MSEGGGAEESSFPDLAERLAREALGDEGVDDDDDILAACDSLCTAVSEEHHHAAQEGWRGVNFPDPEVTTVKQMRWPELPKQWSQTGGPQGRGDWMPTQDPKCWDFPDPGKRNEELNIHLRGYFSTPLKDPQHDMQRGPGNLNPGLDRDFEKQPPKLPPPAPDTAAHLLRQTHGKSMAQWLDNSRKMVSHVASRDVVRVLKQSYKLGKRDREQEALTVAADAMAARAELNSVAADVRATLDDARERRDRAAERARKVADVEAYCAAMREEANARREEAMVLDDEEKKLRDEKAKLLEVLWGHDALMMDEQGLEILEAVAPACALAGLDASAASLSKDLEVLSTW